MKQAMQRLVVLGSTGSIGVNTLDVVSRHPEQLEVFALTASTSVDAMALQCQRYEPVYAVMAVEAQGRKLEQLCLDRGLKTKVLWGADAIVMVAEHELADIVMAAIVGAAGLAACMAAARSGKRLLLANKEALVVGGQLFMDTVAQGGATLLPIDSEHSAIFQSLPDDQASWSGGIDKIILTASGGPFRARQPETLREVMPEEACAHPNWVMGRKISVDSATMMNKALEVIEARYLFNLAPEKIEVVIHPQSVIHSMVQYVDNSIVAQLGTPDMRGPIAYGLSWPRRINSGAQAIDFSTLSALTFESIASNNHAIRFPGLQLAWQTLRAPVGTTAVLNAANELAVAAFLDRKIRYDQIHAVNEETLSTFVPDIPGSLADLLELDQESRRAADKIIQRLKY
jgi:1-deoxy-D-xylulose-5-phosphate reductoisomerase